MAVVKPKDLKVNYEGAWKELEGIIGKHTLHISSAEGIKQIHIGLKMEWLKKKHKNMITLKRRSDNEMVDYCIKKSIESQMENIHLKKKLREYQKGTGTEHWIQVNPNVRVKEKREEVSNQSMQLLREIEEEICNKNRTRTDGVIHINMSASDIYIMSRVHELMIMIPIKQKPERKLFDVHLVTVTNDDLQFVFDWHCTDKKTAYLSNAFKTQEEISWHGLKMRIVDLNIRYPGTEGKDKMAFQYEKYSK